MRGHPYRDLALDSEHGVLEGQLHRDLGVGPAELRRASPPPAPTEGAAATEEGLEDVAQAAAEPGEGVARAWPRPRALDRLGTEEVVAPPALRVAERLVGHGDLLEALLCRGVAGPGVGVQLPGQAPVGALDVVIAGVGGYAEELVVVGGHVGVGGLPDPMPRAGAGRGAGSRRRRR